MDCLDLPAIQGTLKGLLQHHNSNASILRCSAFFTVQFSHPYMTTGKTIALTSRTFVGKVMSLLYPSEYLIFSEREWGFPGGSVVKNQPAKAGDMGLTAKSGEDLLEEEMANHSSILTWRIPMDRGAWRATVHWVTKNQTRLSMHVCEKGSIAFISCEPEKTTQEFQNPITMKAVTVKP